MITILKNIGFCLIIAVDALAGYWLVTLPGWLKLLAFALHVLLVLMAYFILKSIRFRDFKVETNFAWITLSLSLILPVYGLLATLILAHVINVAGLRRSAYFDVEPELAPESYTRLLTRRTPDIFEMHQEAIDMQSYRDVFKSNDRQLEETAIRKLSKLMTRESVAILRDVVRTATSDSKVMAATALIDMEDRISGRIESLRAQLAGNPGDNACRLELARAYDLYCYLDVLDRELREHYRRLAIQEYRSYLIANPRHTRAIYEYGRTLLAAGELDKARRVLSTAVSLAPHDPAAHLWLAEAHYESGDYSSAAAICRRINSFANLPDYMRPVTGWWVEDGGKLWAE